MTRGGWPAIFLAALAKFGDVDRAASVAGVSRQAAYKRRARRDRVGVEFAAAWREAIGGVGRRKNRLTRNRRVSFTL